MPDHLSRACSALRWASTPQMIAFLRLVKDNPGVVALDEPGRPSVREVERFVAFGLLGTEKGRYWISFTGEAFLRAAGLLENVAERSVTAGKGDHA